MTFNIVNKREKFIAFRKSHPQILCRDAQGYAFEIKDGKLKNYFLTYLSILVSYVGAREHKQNTRADPN
jgi:hypothetical protein